MPLELCPLHLFVAFALVVPVVAPAVSGNGAAPQYSAGYHDGSSSARKQYGNEGQGYGAYTKPYDSSRQQQQYGDFAYSPHPPKSSTQVLPLPLLGKAGTPLIIPKPGECYKKAVQECTGLKTTGNIVEGSPVLNLSPRPDIKDARVPHGSRSPTGPPPTIPQLKRTQTVANQVLLDYKVGSPQYVNSNYQHQASQGYGYGTQREHTLRRSETERQPPPANYDNVYYHRSQLPHQSSGPIYAHQQYGYGQSYPAPPPDPRLATSQVPHGLQRTQIHSNANPVHPDNRPPPISQSSSHHRQSTQRERSRYNEPDVLEDERYRSDGTGSYSGNSSGRNSIVPMGNQVGENLGEDPGNGIIEIIVDESDR